MNPLRICCQKDCDEIAAFRYTWPGQNEAFICPRHAVALLHIADAMGLHVQLIRLEERDDRADASAASRDLPTTNH
jgi:hypothetical protein